MSAPPVLHRRDGRAAVAVSVGVAGGLPTQERSSVFGGEDADVDLGSTGRLHVTSLLALVNPAFNQAQLGVSAVSYPNGTSSAFNISACTEQIVDTAGTDRPWITSDGPHVWISYPDSKNASLIHLQARRTGRSARAWSRRVLGIRLHTARYVRDPCGRIVVGER